MGSARLLVDNVFNLRIYNAHTLSALESTDSAGLVGAGRRTTYDAYTSVTTNSEAWVRAQCDRVRGCDMIVWDRGHNVAGKTVKAQLSSDGFSANIEDAFNGALPTMMASGSITDAYGVLTPEGAWLKLFSERGSADWRCDIPAMGASLKPVIPGLWIGHSYSPGQPFRPYGPGVTELIVDETESDFGWRGRGRPTRRRAGTIHFKFANPWDAEQADWHVQRIAEGRPFWIVPDDDRAEQSFLAVLPKALVGMVVDIQQFYPVLDLPYQELDPTADSV